MKIFLSSTYEDLIEYRAKAAQAIERLGQQGIRMEFSVRGMKKLPLLALEKSSLQMLLSASTLTGMDMCRATPQSQLLSRSSISQKKRRSLRSVFLSTTIMPGCLATSKRNPVNQSSRRSKIGSKQDLYVISSQHQKTWPTSFPPH